MWVWFVLIGLLTVNLPILCWLYRTGRMTAWKVACAWPLALVVMVWVAFLEQPRLPRELACVCGPALLALGAFLGLLAFHAYGRQRVPLMPRDWTPPRLVTTGVYRWIRHPQYLAGLLLIAGWFFLGRAAYALIFLAPLLAVTVWLRAWLEERYILGPKFGQQHRDYRKRVGMFIPRIFGRREEPSAAL